MWRIIRSWFTDPLQNYNHDDTCSSVTQNGAEIWCEDDELTSAADASHSDFTGNIKSEIHAPKDIRNGSPRPLMCKKAHSWSGGEDLKSAQRTGAGGGSYELSQNRGILDESTFLAEVKGLPSSMHKDNEGSGPCQSISDGRSSRYSEGRLAGIIMSEGTSGKGSQRHSRAKRKEAKLKRLRWRNLMTRATVAEKRRELRKSRLQMITVDEGLMKMVREMRVQQSEPKYEDLLVLEQQYSRLQATRDRHGLLEDSYNAIEERLDREEYEVTKLEEPLEDDSSSPQPYFGNSEASSITSSENESNSLAFLGDSEDGLYDEYLSRQGEANVIREDLAELRFVYKKLKNAQASRQRVGRSLSREDQAIWENFLSKEAALNEKLRNIQTEVNRLRLECMQAGLLDKADEEDEDKDDDENEEMNILSSSGVSEYERFPLLLEQPSEEKVDERSTSLISDFNPGDRGDRIARWLLHKLRSSCGEVQLLARISASDELDSPVNAGKWQEEVLNFWFFDSTVLPPSAYLVQPAAIGSDLPTSPFADMSNVSLFQSGQAQLIQLAIRSNSIFNKMEFALLLRLTIPKTETARSVR